MYRFIIVLLGSLIVLALAGCQEQEDQLAPQGFREDASIEVESLQDRYDGEHCRNADGTVGGLATKVREKMAFPAAMQILSTEIGPAGRANLGRDGVPTHFSGFGPFSVDTFQSALDDGKDFLVHRVQMELSAKSKSGNIQGMTTYAFIEHLTCAEKWIVIVGSERRDGTVPAYWRWKKSEGWQLQPATFFNKPY